MDNDETIFPAFLNIEDTERATHKIDSLDIDIHEAYCQYMKAEHQVDVKNALLFYLPSQSKPITFIGEADINIGRRDPKGRITPEFDLTDFEARELGVSRLHALITWDGTQYLLQDLHSTNHTYLNGQRLIPYHHAPLTDNATIQVGRLVMTVYIVNRK